MLEFIILGVVLLICVSLYIAPFQRPADMWLELLEPGIEKSNEPANPDTPPCTTHLTTLPKAQSTPLHVVGSPAPAPPPNSQTSTSVTPNPRPSISPKSKYRSSPRPQMTTLNAIPADIFERPPQYLQRPLPVFSAPMALPKSPARTPRTSYERYRSQSLLPAHDLRTTSVDAVRSEPKTSVLQSIRERIGRHVKKFERKETNVVVSEVDGERKGKRKIGSQIAVQTVNDEQNVGLMEPKRSGRAVRGSGRFRTRLRDTRRLWLGLDKEIWVGSSRRNDFLVERTDPRTRSKI